MRKILFWIFWIIVLFMILMKRFPEEELVKDAVLHTNFEIMDKRELWYDADDWFIMIESKSGLVGVYYADRPVEHASCRTAFSWNDEEECVTTWGDIKDQVYGNIYTSIPDWTPVLVYVENYEWVDNYEWE